MWIEGNSGKGGTKRISMARGQQENYKQLDNTRGSICVSLLFIRC